MLNELLSLSELQSTDLKEGKITPTLSWLWWGQTEIMKNKYLAHSRYQSILPPLSLCQEVPVQTESCHHIRVARPTAPLSSPIFFYGQCWGQKVSNELICSFKKYIIMFWMLETATTHSQLLLGIKINSRHWIYNTQKEVTNSIFSNLRAEYRASEQNEKTPMGPKWLFSLSSLTASCTSTDYFYRANSA